MEIFPVKRKTKPCILSMNHSALCKMCSFFFPAQLMRKEIAATFERLHSQAKSKSCVFMVTGSPVIIWPNKDFHAIPEQITAQTVCKDIHQWIQ